MAAGEEWGLSSAAWCTCSVSRFRNNFFFLETRIFHSSLTPHRVGHESRAPRPCMDSLIPRPLVARMRAVANESPACVLLDLASSAFSEKLPPRHRTCLDHGGAPREGSMEVTDDRCISCVATVNPRREPRAVKVADDERPQARAARQAARVNEPCSHRQHTPTPSCSRCCYR